MSTPMPPAPPQGQGSSTRPYLIRALHDWCTDNGFTPYLAVHVDRSVQVPSEFVKNDEIVLNASFEATSGLQLGNEFISFKARFGGTARDILVPVDHVIAIYARENGQGMAFPMPTPGTVPGSEPASEGPRSLRLASAAPSSGEDEPAQAGEGAEGSSTLTPETSAKPPEPPEPSPGGRPSLKRVK